MDIADHGGVTTEQILAILGAKEVEIQVMRQREVALSQQVAALSAQLEALAQPAEAT